MKHSLTGLSIIIITLLLLAPPKVFAQRIARASLSSFGNTTNSSGTVFRQTIGQSSNTSVFSSDKTVLRQGFQQPLTSNKGATQKECTLYLNPNPANDMVTIQVKEHINNNQISVFNMMGELIFGTNINTPYYHLNVSNFTNGMYMVNVISQSGYECREKLVVIR